MATARHDRIITNIPIKGVITAQPPEDIGIDKGSAYELTGVIAIA